MHDTDRELWNRLQHFQIDEGTPQLPFAQRLADENSWTIGYATRVVDEYKRFVFLAVTVGHVVTPSKAVDAAWHLHLTYTRSYWERLCGEVLGRPLHHDPTRGGDAEEAKYKSLYLRTKDAYREAFGEDPPADIWPGPGSQAHKEHPIPKLSETHWLIPKRPVLSVRNAIVIGPLALLIAGCTTNGLSPEDIAVNMPIVFFVLIALALVVAGSQQKKSKDNGCCSGGGGGCGGGGGSSDHSHDGGGADAGGSDGGGSCGGGGCGGGCGGGD